jgi:16S rRNA (cytosine967-C5)-methyltransferase
MDLKGRELPTFEPTPFAPLGIRVTGPDGGPPALDLQALKPYGDGRVEVQDEGSQIAAALVGAKPGETVVDLCAGAGGKTLALAAAMENKGQVFACDVDAGRLEEARKRIQRSHVRNAQTHKLSPAWLDAPDWPAPLADLVGKADRVVLDVPCSGSGAWRRSPDARWRLERDWLDRTLTLQAALAERALGLVRPGGWLVYITCSIFECENQNQIKILQEKSDKLDEVDMAAQWAAILGAPAPDAVRNADGLAGGLGLTLSPRRSATDGFFIAAVQRLA